jgi:hypothetical protein
MRTEQQQLHELYGKHEPGPKVYRCEGLDWNDASALTQCSCGDWLACYRLTDAWEPLYGLAAVNFINDYPELYPLLKAWWPNKPHNPEDKTSWRDIDRYVSYAIKTRQGTKEAK